MLIAFLCKILCLCSLPTPTKNLYSKSSGGWGLEIPVQTAQHLHNVKSFMLPGCFKLTMSFSNFHLHCLKCHTKDDSLFSPFLWDVFVNLGKKLITFLETSVGSGDEQMANQNSTLKGDYLLCRGESYFGDTVKILDLILSPRWSSE